jgi:uncharacterized RDD family membrane protein YckC
VDRGLDSSAMADRKPSPPPEDDALATRVLGGGVRAGRAIAGATGVDRALDTAAEEAIVRALDSPAVERAAIRLADEGRLEEILVAAADHVDVEGMVSKTIDSDAADRIWREILASDKAQMLVERVAEAPEVRAAIAQQGFGLISDIGRQVSRLTEGLDDLLERLAHKILPGQGDAESEAEEAGFVTRLVAFAIDIALIVGALSLSGAVLSALIPFAFGDGDGLPGWAIATLLALGFVFGAALFANFWYLVGQTPGMRFLGIRLVADGGGDVSYKMAVRRSYMLPLAIAAAGLGVLAILVNPKRQGWHDRFAHTVVIYDESSAPWSGMEGGRPQLEGRKRRHFRDRKLEEPADTDQPAA